MLHHRITESHQFLYSSAVPKTVLNNLDLWKFSLDNPEPPFGDPYYVLDNENIITNSANGQAHPLILLEENIIQSKQKLCTA